MSLKERRACSRSSATIICSISSIAGQNGPMQTNGACGGGLRVRSSGYRDLFNAPPHPGRPRRRHADPRPWHLGSVAAILFFFFFFFGGASTIVFILRFIQIFIQHNSVVLESESVIYTE